MVYTRRTVDTELDALFPHIPAIALDGPKAVGKTTTAREHRAHEILLDNPQQAGPVKADPSIVLGLPRPLLIDEWQSVPETWDVVRRAVDEDSRGGQFLLTGSASPAPLNHQHSGAGRIGRLRMRPLGLDERGLETATVSMEELLSGRRPPLRGSTSLGLRDYTREILQSGFPAIRSLTGRALRFQLDSYLSNIADRDIMELGGPARRSAQVLAWLRAYAAATSSTANYTTILNAATPGESDKPSRQTASVYTDALTRLWIIDPVSAWIPSGAAFKRLAESPKHHLADPALAARLLGASEDSLLSGEGALVSPQAGTLLGALFESLVTLTVRTQAQALEASTHHFRTRNGDHEIDLILERDDGRVLALEVKLAAAIDDADVRQLVWLKEQLGDRVLDTIVVNTGPHAYRRPDGIGVVPLALLGL